MDKLTEYAVRVDSRDVDGTGRCRPSALLGYLQQAATVAAEACGFDRAAVLERYGTVWMLARVRYELDRPLRWEDELTVVTWHRGGRHGSMYRDFDLLSNGVPAGRATSLWALAGVEDRKIRNLSHVPELADSALDRPDRKETLSRLRLPAAMETAERRPMRYSDTDVNAHVNNTRYADFACDAIHAEQLPTGRYVRALQIGYVVECRPGEILTIRTAVQGDERFIQGVDEEGKERFQAQLTLGVENA